MKLSSFIVATSAAIGLCIGPVMGASLVDRHVKSMTNAHLFPEASYDIVVDASEKSSGEGLDSYGRPISVAASSERPRTSNKYVTPRSDRYFGTAWLGTSFRREMQEFAGVDIVDASGDDALHKIKTTHIVKTSPLHADGIVGEDLKSNTSGRAALPVGFYVLNNNPNAYFEMNDDELCIPIVKGSFVTFNGLKLHRTVITNGSVDLLGPFDMVSAKCVKANIMVSLNSSGKLTAVNKKRQLTEEVGNETIISGKVFHGIVSNKMTNDMVAQKLAYNVTGLPPCTNNCNISIALSKTQECTQETHDGATMIPLLGNQLTYTTDEEGSTNMERQFFNADGGLPAGQQFLALAQKAFEDPTLVQESVLSVFFYDEVGELLACSFMTPIISDEDKEIMEKIIAMFTAADLDTLVDSISSAIEDALESSGSSSSSSGGDAVSIQEATGGSSSGSTLWLSLIAMTSVFALSALLLIA